MQIKARNLLLCATAGLFAMFSASAFAATYTVGIEPAFAPWAAAEGGEYKGIAPDAIRAIAKQQGFEVKFESLPFSSLIPALRSNKIDIVATGFTVTPERAEKIAFTIPWWEVTLDVLVKKDSDKNIVTAMCCGAKVGAQSGSTEHDWLEANLIGNDIDIKIHSYDEDLLGAKDVEIGRLDSYLVDSNTGDAIAAAKNSKVRIAGTVLEHPPEVYALGVRKDDTELLRLLNKGEVELYESGEWEAIVHKYLPDTTVGPVPGFMSQDIPTYVSPVPGLDD